MSCNYAEGLSPYEQKGKLGLPEKFDKKKDVKLKVKQLAEMIQNSKHIVVHTGAGISTSAGIPDFRGPKGVWTLEKKGLKPNINISWDDAKPTKTHMGLAKLVQDNKVAFIVSQNIDGLHLRSGVPRSNLAELHGNMFIDQCNTCHRQFVRPSAAPTVGQKVSDVSCPASKPNGRPCRGRLADFVLDWEDELPDSDLDLAESHSCIADLSIVMGSTMQIIPSGNFPNLTKKYNPNGKVVICNLQPTKHDKKADLIIRCYVDEIMEQLFKVMGMEIPEFDPEGDPVRRTKNDNLREKYEFIEWTQCKELAENKKKIADLIDEEWRQKRKLEREAKRKKEEEEEEEEEGEDDGEEEKEGKVKEESREPQDKKPKVEKEENAEQAEEISKENDTKNGKENMTEKKEVKEENDIDTLEEENPNQTPVEVEQNGNGEDQNLCPEADLEGSEISIEQAKHVKMENAKLLDNNGDEKTVVATEYKENGFNTSCAGAE